MSLDAWKYKATQPEAAAHLVRAVGGTTAVTKQIGTGVAVTRTGAGAYRLTWSENPGNFINAIATLEAATPGDVAGHTVVFDTWDATNLRLDLVVYNASDSAHDLAANEYFNVVANFKPTAVGGA